LPELPETETIARDLDALVRGAVIERVTVPRPDVLREVSARTLARRVRAATIKRCWRRAKLVVIDLSTDDRLVVQPRFTGTLLVVDEGERGDKAVDYTAVALALGDGRTLRYRDIRRLGTVTLMTPARFDAYSGALGPEPLDPAFTPSHLSGLLRGSAQAVKKVIMDQRRVVGIGNIYANEALWRARIDPSREARSLDEPRVAALHAAVVDVLTEAIAARGTTFRDFRDAYGGRGGFAERLAVYGRGGERCPHCASRLVTTHAIDGRATVLCVRCQS
jgi:formamidopyrimidine-DNA glycosylase